MPNLQEIEVDEYLHSTVNVEPLAIEEEFVRLPADLAYWNMRFAKAHEAHLRAKEARVSLDSRLHMEMRETLMGAATDAARDAEKAAELPVPEGGKKKSMVKVSIKPPTAGDIEAAVQQHPEMQVVREAEIIAEVERLRVQGVVDAVHSKRDMLIQLGARLRIEMEHDPQIRERAAVDRAKREGMG